MTRKNKNKKSRGLCSTPSLPVTSFRESLHTHAILVCPTIGRTRYSDGPAPQQLLVGYYSRPPRKGGGNRFVILSSIDAIYPAQWTIEIRFVSQSIRRPEKTTSCSSYSFATCDTTSVNEFEPYFNLFIFLFNHPSRRK